jgi:hypothetical protein
MQIIIPEFSKIIQERMIDDDGTNGYRNTAILLYILKMVKRGDSKKTIHDVYYFLSSYPEPQKEKL